MISGIIALFFFPIIGVPYALTVGFLMATVGVIPVIGRALVYVPVSLYFLAIGDPIKALWVLILSIFLFQIVVGSISFRLGHRGRRAYQNPLPSSRMFPFAALGLAGSL